MTLLVLAGLIVGTGIMYMTTQKELAPEEDQGILFTLVKTPQYANLDYLEDATQQLYQVYSSVPEKEHVFTINGMGDVHQAFSGILLKPWGERQRNQKAVLQELSPKISSIAPALALSFSPPALPGSTGGPPVQFVITTTQRLPPARRRGCRCREIGEAKAGCSSSPIPISASRRRRSSSRSTTTRRTGSASPWPISAPRSPPCSAATTSICSIFTGGAIG